MKLGASLLQPFDRQNPTTDLDTVGKLGGDRLCMKAAIGVSYQGKPTHSMLLTLILTGIESTILVAMRSQLLPSQPSAQVPQGSMDLGLSMDLSQPQPVESPFTAEWEVWGEEQMITLCEVRVEFRGAPSRCYLRSLLEAV